MTFLQWEVSSIRRIKTIKIRGRPWSIQWPTRINAGKYYGFCEFDKSLISIEQGLRNRKLLEITIHEMLHADFPKAGEKAVTEAAKDIADALWRMGFRVTD